MLLALLLLGWFGTPAQRRPDWAQLRPAWWPQHWGLGAFPPIVDAANTAPAWLNPAAMEIALGVDADPRWSEELAQTLGELEPFRVDDSAALEAFRATLERLSFVRGVECSVSDPSAGCALDLFLREPVACIPSNGFFYSVDEQGVVLSGAWEKPPYDNEEPLPVIGPMIDGEQLFRLVRPGDWLVESEHLDALHVARSMAGHLAPETRRAMGRLVIDATRGRTASLDNPGIELLLGARRLVVFGRPVDTDEPGELPVADKWASLEDCLMGAGSEDLAGWALLDLRWDHYEVDLAPMHVARLDPAPQHRAQLGRLDDAPMTGPVRVR